MGQLTVGYAISIAFWFCFELSLLVRDLLRRRASSSRDRGTRTIVSMFFYAAVLLGVLMPVWVPALDTPAPRAFAIAGIVVFWLGLGLRVWAVAVLGRSFRTVVAVDADQTVIQRGPFRWVRHPSYLGLLVIVLGLAVGAGNWLSIVVSTGVALVGLLPRIVVEEAELARVLGEPYRAYQRTTRRLIPGVW